jgi:formate transporter
MRLTPDDRPLALAYVRHVTSAPTTRAPSVDGAGTPPPSLDALMPPAITAKATDIGVTKAGMSTLRTFVLAVLAGAFIALGAMFATVTGAGAAGHLPFGVARLLAGLSFCLGLILVVVAGAELFTGNTLIVMAVAERRVAFRRLMRNWGLVYAGNLVGAVATVLLVFASRQYEFGDGSVGVNALAIAQAKTSLGFGQAIALGVLCNALVCLAIWLTYSARTVADKILAIIFPITAFVAAGFEHSVANMYFLPMGVLLRDHASAKFWQVTGKTAASYPDVTWGHALVSNLVPVTIGNVFGGGVMVGLVYWLVYARTRD